MSLETADEILDRDATGQAEVVRRGEVTPVDLVEAAIGRIERRDPGLNAVVMPLFDQARRVAARPRARRKVAGE